MPLRDCHHWIFDMDGTLTIPVHDFNDIRRQLGILENTPILEAIEDMAPDQADWTRKRLHEIEMDIAALARPQPMVDHVLETLSGRGATLGILTRNDEDIARETLRASGLLGFFPEPCIVGRETCAPKPNPDGVNHLLNLWQVEAARTVMVGDFLYDIEAGKRAGVRTVHFDCSGAFPWPEYTDHGVTELAQILSLIGLAQGGDVTALGDLTQADKNE